MLGDIRDPRAWNLRGYYIRDPKVTKAGSWQVEVSPAELFIKTVTTLWGRTQA